MKRILLALTTLLAIAFAAPCYAADKTGINTMLEFMAKAHDNGDGTYSMVVYDQALAGSTGTAGTPSSSVMSVQGVSGGQPVPIAGTTANTVVSAGNPFPVALYVAGGTTALANSASTTDTLGGSSAGVLTVNSWGRLWNGTTGSRPYEITASTGTGLGVASVSAAPNSAAGAAITPVKTSVAASNLVAKSGAGNLYSWRVTTGGTAGYVMIFDATSAPADGTVTPVDVVAVAANSTVGSTDTVPDRFATGIVIVFSSTGPYSKTASATAFIKAKVQ